MPGGKIEDVHGSFGQDRTERPPLQGGDRRGSLLLTGKNGSKRLLTRSLASWCTMEQVGIYSKNVPIFLLERRVFRVEAGLEAAKTTARRRLATILGVR